MSRARLTVATSRSAVIIPPPVPDCTGSVDLGQIDLSKYSRVGQAGQGPVHNPVPSSTVGAVTVIGVVVRPRSTFAALAASPRLPLGFAAVLGSGLVALVLSLIADRIGSGGTSGLVTSLLLPILFLVDWGAAALIIDAVAGLTAGAR